MSVSEAVRRSGLVPSIVSGLLLALAYPRPGFGLLGLVALVPFLLSLRHIRSATALARGYACGAGFFFPLLYWIAGVVRQHGGLPRPLGVLALATLVFYLATYFALFAWLIAASWRRFGALALLTVPIAWVGLELVRGQLMGGFPWGLLGYSQTSNLALLQVAAFGGIYLVSFVVASANAALALLMVRHDDRRERLGAGALALVVLVAAIGGRATLSWPGSDSGSVAVAAVQGNVAQERKWRAGEGEAILQALVDLTRDAVDSGASLVVWPESASPLSLYRPVRREPGADGAVEIAPNPEFYPVVTALIDELDITLITGSVDYRLRNGRLAAFNSAFALTGDGPTGPAYDKIKLVPFGEYVPFGRLLFFVDSLVQGAIANFAPGESWEPLPTGAGAAATFICYEAIFPELVRRLASRADFLVNITNDAWFGASSAPEQHLAMARVRAVENRRYLLRAANTGISAIIDPFGRVVSRTRLNETTVLNGVIGTRRDTTLYARVGDLLGWGCVILTILQAAALRAAFVRPAGSDRMREHPGR